MVETNWRTVVAGLSERRTPTAAQHHVAKQLGLVLGAKWHTAVAAGYLRRHLGATIGYEPASGPPVGLDYALGLGSSLRVRIPTEHRTSSELVDGWIHALHDLRAERALKALKPNVGDIVTVAAKSFAPDELQTAEIKSISADGQLNFVGGRGARARPHRVEVLARVGDPDHKATQATAANLAAKNRGRLLSFDDAHHAELAPFYVGNDPGIAAQNALLEGLEDADDEAPLQKVLEQYPELLAVLVTGNHGCWVIPRPRLNEKYIPDFLIASQTSAGVTWWLVELESPTQPLHMKNRHLAKGPRQGIAQIEDWREHIRGNQANINKLKSDGGLGFPGLRSDARGLVVVGRGALTSHVDPARASESAQKNIEIRTYDWLTRAHRPRAAIGALEAEVVLDFDDLL